MWVKRLVVQSRPSLFKAIHGLAGGGELLCRTWHLSAGLFFQFKHERQTSLRCRLEDLDGRGPINGAVVGRKVLVFFAVIVVEVDGGDEFPQWREAFFESLIFRKIGEVRVADIEIEAQAGEARFIHERAEIT